MALIKDNLFSYLRGPVISCLDGIFFSTQELQHIFFN